MNCPYALSSIVGQFLSKVSNKEGMARGQIPRDTFL